MIYLWKFKNINQYFLNENEISTLNKPLDTWILYTIHVSSSHKSLFDKMLWKKPKSRWGGIVMKNGNKHLYWKAVHPRNNDSNMLNRATLVWDIFKFILPVLLISVMVNLQHCLLFFYETVSDHKVLLYWSWILFI